MCLIFPKINTHTYTHTYERSYTYVYVPMRPSTLGLNNSSSHLAKYSTSSISVLCITQTIGIHYALMEQILKDKHTAFVIFE